MCAFSAVVLSQHTFVSFFDGDWSVGEDRYLVGELAFVPVQGEPDTYAVYMSDGTLSPDGEICRTFEPPN